MVVPFAAGGPTDTVARLVAESMSADLGQQIIVENVGGAGGTLGAGQVADGRGGRLHHPAAPHRHGDLRHALPQPCLRPARSLRICRPRHRGADDHRRAQGLRAGRRRRRSSTTSRPTPTQITMANAGIGAASHLCGMLFMQALDAPIVTVPYKGTGPAMTDLLGGQVDIMCDQTTNTTEQIKGGTIKAYAVTTPARLDVFPDVPTVAEGGLPGMEVGIWHGIYAPKGTPAEVIERLSAVAAGRAGRPGRRSQACRTRHRAVARRRRDARRAEGQARGRDRALEADHRGRRRLRRLIDDRAPARRRRRGPVRLPRRRIRRWKPHRIDRADAAAGRFCSCRSGCSSARSRSASSSAHAFRMGPGYFPLVLSGVLILLRARLIAVQRLRDRRREPIGQPCLARHALHPARADLLRPDRAGPRLRAVDLPDHADRGASPR